MPYSHLIAATVTTLRVCQSHSSIASFFLYWQACRGLAWSLCHSRACCCMCNCGLRKISPRHVINNVVDDGLLFLAPWTVDATRLKA